MHGLPDRRSPKSPWNLKGRISPRPFWHRVHLEGALSPPSRWVPPIITTHALPFICLIPHSSELLKETLVCLFSSSLALFISRFPRSYSAFAVSPHLSTPGFMCHRRCFMQHQKCYWRGWEGRHEGIKPTAPRQRRWEGSSAEYWGNHPDKRNQTANGPCNSVESFKS